MFWPPHCTVACLGLPAEALAGKELITFQQRIMTRHLEMTVSSQTEILQQERVEKYLLTSCVTAPDGWQTA